MRSHRSIPRSRVIYLALALMLVLGAGSAVYWLRTDPAQQLASRTASEDGSLPPAEDPRQTDSRSPAGGGSQTDSQSPAGGGSKVAYRTVPYDELPPELRAAVDRRDKDQTVLVAKGDGEFQYVLITLGERPTAGYQAVVDAVRDTGGRIQVEYREITPAKGSMAAQVLTYPWAAVQVDTDLPIDLVPSERVTLEPVDEASEDPSFSAFREAMLSAIERRDVDFLMKSLHPQVFPGFGSSGTGPEVFAESWHPEKPDSEVWTKLKEVLELGGAFKNYNGTEYFVAPYTFASFPETLDQFTHAVVYKPAARLRKGPAPDAPIIATLGHEVVKLLSFEPKDGFWEVSARGLRGWVSTDDARLPLDYRALFTRVDGQWKLWSFVAGD